MFAPPRLRALVLTAAAVALAAAPGCEEGAPPEGEDGETPLAEAQLPACDFGPGLPGIDVSYYQGTVDWNAVASDGWRWAIARVSHSTSFIDPEFPTNWAGIKAAGMVRGVYQYFEPEEDPVAQAQVVIDAVGMLGSGDLPAVIDVEEGGAPSSTYIENVHTWIDLVEAGTGKKPMIYTGSYFWDDNLGTDEFNEHPLWVAHYTTNCPRVPETWGGDWTFWQYTDQGGIPGIPGNVDKNWFRGDEAALQLLAGGSGGDYGATKIEVRAPSTVLVGETFEVSVRYLNSGAQAWDTSTLLGTTEPRDRPSDFADASWVNDHRAAAAEPTAPGEEHTFEILLQAPDVPGAYVEHFGLVQEGVGWFADAGGPPDDAVRIPLQVVESGDVGAGGGGAGNGEDGDADGDLDPDGDTSQVGSGGTDEGGGASDSAADEGGCAVVPRGPGGGSGGVSGVGSGATSRVPLAALLIVALAWLRRRVAQER